MLHVLLAMDYSAFSNIALKLTLKGIKRQSKFIPQQKAAITPEILLKVCKTLDFNKAKSKCFWALCLVAFFCLLRKSNLVPDSIDKFDPKK